MLSRVLYCCAVAIVVAVTIYFELTVENSIDRQFIEASFSQDMRVYPE